MNYFMGVYFHTNRYGLLQMLRPSVHLPVCAGTVRAIEEPLSSQFKEGTVGVIQKLLLREHKLVWNSLARTW